MARDVFPFSAPAASTAVHQEKQAEAPVPFAQPVELRPAQTSSLTHLIFLGSLLLPFAVVPYFAIRRHLVHIRQTVDEVGATTAALQRELKTTVLENAIRREEQVRTRQALDESKRELERLRAEGEQARLALAAEKGVTRRRMHDLAEDNRRTRAQLAVLNGLGPSLADVAAFMHEIELRQALPLHKQDERLGGIERLRQLALKMQSLQLWYERKQTDSPVSHEEREQDPNGSKRM